MTTHIDDDMIGPICELADMDITDDYQLNQLCRREIARSPKGWKAPPTQQTPGA